MALKASFAAAIILALFAATGGAIFAFFGITLPAFQIAGGILFTIMGLSTLQHDEREPRTEGVAPGRPFDRADRDAADRGARRHLDGHGARRAGPRRHASRGPGRSDRGQYHPDTDLLLAAPWLVARIGETGQRIVAKIMGLITAVIGVQFVLNGVETVALAILKSSRG